MSSLPIVFIISSHRIRVYGLMSSLPIISLYVSVVFTAITIVRLLSSSSSYPHAFIAIAIDIIIVIVTGITTVSIGSFTLSSVSYPHFLSFLPHCLKQAFGPHNCDQLPGPAHPIRQIFVMRIQIYVAILMPDWATTITLDVEVSDTIDDVKVQIQNNAGFFWTSSI